jgi:hypothetical protein
MSATTGCVPSIAVLGKKSKSKEDFVACCSEQKYRVAADSLGRVCPQHAMLPLRVLDWSIARFNEGPTEPAAVVLVIPGTIFASAKSKSGAAASCVQAVQGLRQRLAQPTQLPIAIVLNIDSEGRPAGKDDVDSVVNEARAALRDIHEDVIVMAVSPRTELWLLEKRALGLKYTAGASTFHVAPAFLSIFSAEEMEASAKSMAVLGGTGVQSFLSRLMERAPLAYVLPVSDLKTKVSLGYEDGSTMVDVLAVRHTATISELVEILKASGRVSADLIVAKSKPLHEESGDDEEPPRSLAPNDSVGMGVWLVEFSFNRRPKVMRGKIADQSKALPAVKLGDLRNKNRKA